jgi:hypothetical protein
MTADELSGKRRTYARREQPRGAAESDGAMTERDADEALGGARGRAVSAVEQERRDRAAQADGKHAARDVR